MVQAELELALRLNGFNHAHKALMLNLGECHMLRRFLVGYAKVREHALNIKSGKPEDCENFM